MNHVALHMSNDLLFLEFHDGGLWWP